MDQTTKLNFKNSMIILLLSFVIIAGVLKTVFYNENSFTILKTTGAISWLLIIPGYCITCIWKKEINNIERIIISIPISAAVLGISSYYLGLAGLNLKIQSVLLPSLIIAVTVSIYMLTKEHMSRTTGGMRQA